MEPDRFTPESHRRATVAIDSGEFDDEIVPVAAPHLMGLGTIPATPKPLQRTSLAVGHLGLIKLNEAFRPFYGLVTLCVSVGQDESTLVEWIG